MAARKADLLRAVAGAILASILAASCSTGGSPTAAGTPPAGTRTSSPPSPHPTRARTGVPPESPVPAESNPPGDIPDDTQYVAYRSAPGHFEVKVPEGWSRTTGRSTVSFTDKLNTIAATWFRGSSAPTAGSARSRDVPMLRRTVRAFTFQRIVGCAPSCTIPYSTGPIDVRLASAAVVITYESNSAPNAVTGKQYRDENLRFEFFNRGEEVALTLSGPVAADNIDPWRLVSESFGWK